MKFNSKKVVTIILMLFLTIVISGDSLAHSGKTDADGGHKDNQNKSGLGSYHYHCGGHPAHLHNNGVCPYSSGSSNSSNVSNNKKNTIVVSTHNNKVNSTSTNNSEESDVVSGILGLGLLGGGSYLVYKKYKNKTGNK